MEWHQKSRAKLLEKANAVNTHVKLIKRTINMKMYD